MTEKEKQPFVELAAKDHERYDREVLHLRTHGFFINKDGKKSTDMKKKLSQEERKKQEKASQEAKGKSDKEKEKAAREKALELAKLDKPSKCGFDEFVKSKYLQMSKAFNFKSAKEQHSKTQEACQEAWLSLSESTRNKYEKKAEQAISQAKEAKKAEKKRALAEASGSVSDATKGSKRAKK